VSPSRPSRHLIAGSLCAATLALGGLTWAVSTATFEVATFEAFDKGEPQGTLISSEGEVVAGFGSQALEGPSHAMIWSRARGDGETVYLGTGDPGKILAVRRGKVREVADPKAVLVTALAMGPGGRLLAGTMPDARILEVNPKTGKWRQLAKLPTEHVWALLYDARTRRIFAASGAPGKLFVIPAAGGKPRVHFDPKEQHLLCLTRDRRGYLLTGSSDKAVLYRVDAGGKASAVHDFDATELRDVAVSRTGAIYVAVNQFTRKTAGLPRYDRVKEGEGGTPLSTDKKSGSKKSKVAPNELRPGAKRGKGALFRIDPDGRTDELLALPKGYFTDLEIDGRGMLWAGDGTEGKVYLVRSDRTVLTAFDLRERQVLALSVERDPQIIATGDAGAIYRVTPAADAPTYLSEPLDAKFSARWGMMQVQATGELALHSRSGNTAKPDDTWNGWREARRVVPDRLQLLSPGARYLQVKAVWRRPYQAALRSFTVYYRPQNQRAEVNEITFERAKVEKNKPRTPKIKIKWKVENPDKDPLVYRLGYRGEMEVDWLEILTPEPIEKLEHEWDTESVPDGRYRVRVIASDERANGPEVTLLGREISAPILVDNRRPEVANLTLRKPWVAGIARDSYSPIKGVQYAIDGGPWRLVSAGDGIYDSPSETFRIKLPLRRLGGGPHVLAVRASDEAGNVGVAQLRFVR